MGKKLVVLVLTLILAFGMCIPVALAASTRTEATLPDSMGGLIIRTGPGTGYDVAGWVKDGSAIDVISAGSKWSKIKAVHSGKTGYINNAYIKQLPKSDGQSSSESLSTTGTATAGRVTGKSVNLRKGAGTGYATVKSLPSGTKLKIWGEKGNWYYVSTLSGTSGWMSKSYVKEGFTSETTARVNFRKSANGALVKTLDKGTSVSVVSMTGGWSKVKVDNTTGYVYTKYLK